MAVAMDITVTEEAETQQVYNSQPSHPFYKPRLDRRRSPAAAAAINMINLNPEPADDDHVNSRGPTKLITPIMAQREADFISISIVDGHDMQSMDEEQQSHTRSWREIRYLSFSSRTNSSSFRTVGGDVEEEETRRGNNNPIVTALRENEMGKMAMTLAVSITTGLLGIKNSSSSSSAHYITVCVIALALSLGYAATWNGILIRKINISSSSTWTSGGVSDLIEQLGIGLLLTAFFATLGLLFPLNLSWIPSLGFALSLIPFLMRFFKVRDP